MNDTERANSTPISPLGKVLNWFGRSRFRIYGTIAASILSIPVGFVGVLIDSAVLRIVGIALAAVGAMVVASMVIASLWDDYLANRSQ
jgi:hypothetical protein